MTGTAPQGQSFLRKCALRCLVLVLAVPVGQLAQAEEAAKIDAPPKLKKLAPPPPPNPEVGDIFVAEYRVRGATLLNGQEIGDAVYPYLGPLRTNGHIDQARAALQKAYHDKGYQTVSVTVPPQTGARGVIFLDVEETKIGKLRVKGARYFLPSDIKRRAPSMAPGTVPNFTDVQRDIIKLNSSADLQVMPELVPGAEPGTVDMNLNVKDTLPLHGRVELNNRYSENTVPLRLSGGLNYANLWQLSHDIGFSFQVAPEDPDDATVYSAYYSIPLWDRWRLQFSGTKQDSDVSTLGGAAVVGRGEILGIRANVDLPSDPDNLVYHNLSFGIDYKSFDEDVAFGGAVTQTPIDYYPFTIAYYFSTKGKKSFTEGNLSASWHHRGMGSDVFKFDDKRFNADGAYILFRGDVARTQELPGGFQVMGKFQGQFSNYPLINTEQYSGGGQSTVRGYLESAALGDSGWFGTLELRSPSFLKKWKKNKPKDADTAAATADQEIDPSLQPHEWRVYAFLDGGRLFVNDTLPEQQETYDLASVGVGTRLRLWDTLHGSMDVAMPLESLGTTAAHDWFVSFRVWSEF